MSEKLVWLASYPKSGNTWLRLFLTAYCHPERPELDINKIDVSQHAANRELFDNVIGLPSSDMSPAEIDRLRPFVYRQLAAETKDPLFIKVHDHWHRSVDGTEVFPRDVTRATVCIVRDPRAIAASYASHYNLSVGDAIARMEMQTLHVSESEARLGVQLPQHVGSWSQHVTSWLDQADLKAHLIRYEDLHAEPARHFARLVELAGLEYNSERLARALEMSRFERLQSQEDAVGFKERPTESGRFFRRGKTNGWRDELTPEQIEKIIAAHGQVMNRLGYKI